VTLASGARLGPYEIIVALGAGGMGEVYKARDTRLDRTVAIKILPDALAGDPQFRDRFDREARTISQLDHPHICALYDVGEQDGTSFLVMQYLEGETLADRLAKGALPLDQALQVSIHIADALATAHRVGIVHRDLKPGNIMLTKGGAKLLDFGLAKTGASVLSGTNLSMLPTTPPITQRGSILGTFQYMAPEQLEGQEADARTDIFAFGAVVYEMITGRKAFQGKSQASLIGAIMHAEPPPLTTVQPLTPPVLDRMVGRCLAKEPDDRWQSARDLGFGLAEALAVARPDTRPVKNTRRELVLTTVTALACLLAAVFGVLAYRARVTPTATDTPEVIRLIVPAPNGEALPSSNAADGGVAVSPDGRYLTFTTVSPQTNRRRLWVRALASLDVRALEGTDDAAWPFWSPDSRFIGFGVNGQLKRVSVTGGEARTICDISGTLFAGGTWNQRDEIVFGAFNSGLFRVAAAGGTPVPLAMTPDVSRQEIGHLWPQFLPDGRHLIFFVLGSRPEYTGQYVGSLDSPERSRIALKANTAGVTNAAYTSGFILYHGEPPTLMAQRFDLTTMKTQGEPIVVLDDLAWDSIFGFRVHFSVSRTGVLAYQPVPLPGTRLVWFDRLGKELRVLRADGERYVDPEISPDGRWVAVDRLERKTGRIHVVLIDVGRGTMSRLNPELAADARPIWSHDSKSLLFEGGWQGLQGPWSVYRKSLGAAVLASPIAQFANPTYPADWSRDGQTAILAQFSLTVGLLELQMRNGTTTPLVAGVTQGRLSPDGQWVAYTSDESGARDIYVRSVSGEGLKKVSDGGGQNPHWRGDGGELFYANDRWVMAVDVKPGSSSLDLGRPHTLFEHATFMNVQPAPTPGGNDFAVSADGQRLLLNVLDEKATQSPITVVVNWQAALKK
jgi:serine/threonine protein kinase/Tol biopolymer transport system component